MVLSVLRQTLNKVVRCACYWLRRRSGGGELEGRGGEDRDGEEQEVRPQRLFIHSQDFFT